MFAAIILVCGLNPSPMTPEGCALAMGNVPFAEKLTCDVARMRFEEDIKGKLPEGSYIVNSECINMGRSS